MNRQETHGSKIARKRDEGAKAGDLLRIEDLQSQDHKTCRDGHRQEIF
ncbi:hypothetical protein HZ326_30502, partial [Fusarium oxysporum f. sp. albedinis]